MTSKKLQDMTDEELRERWRGRLEQIKQDFNVIADGQQRFEHLVEIVNGNVRLQQTGGAVIEWIYRNHAYATVAAVRRHADGQTNDCSLETLLCEIAKYPHVINRGAFMAQWGTGPDNGYMARRSFEQLTIKAGPDGPDSDHIDPEAVRADIQAIENATKRIIDWANRHVTHLSAWEVAPVTFAELRQAITELEGILRRYYALVTQKSVPDFAPVHQFDPDACFTFPWLGDAATADKEDE